MDFLHCRRPTLKRLQIDKRLQLDGELRNGSWRWEPLKTRNGFFPEALLFAPQRKERFQFLNSIYTVYRRLPDTIVQR